jgi:predicted enzyme related to lactoylglutathione lyase
MPSRIAVIAIDAVRPEVVAEFWCEVLGWSVVAVEEDIVSIGPEDATWPAIDIVAVPEGKVVKNRVHLDLIVDDIDAEAARWVGLGATRVSAEPVREGDECWIVMLDPEGNEVCLCDS